jgi:hypothetical protein
MRTLIVAATTFLAMALWGCNELEEEQTKNPEQSELIDSKKTNAPAGKRVVGGTKKKETDNAQASAKKDGKTNKEEAKPKMDERPIKEEALERNIEIEDIDRVQAEVDPIEEEEDEPEFVYPMTETRVPVNSENESEIHRVADPEVLQAQGTAEKKGPLVTVIAEPVEQEKTLKDIENMDPAEKAEISRITEEILASMKSVQGSDEKALRLKGMRIIQKVLTPLGEMVREDEPLDKVRMLILAILRAVDKETKNRFGVVIFSGPTNLLEISKLLLKEVVPKLEEVKNANPKPDTQNPSGLLESLESLVYDVSLLKSLASGSTDEESDLQNEIEEVDGNLRALLMSQFETIDSSYESVDAFEEIAHLIHGSGLSLSTKETLIVSSLVLAKSKLGKSTESQVVLRLMKPQLFAEFWSAINDLEKLRLTEASQVTRDADIEKIRLDSLISMFKTIQSRIGDDKSEEELDSSLGRIKQKASADMNSIIQSRPGSNASSQGVLEELNRVSEYLLTMVDEQAYISADEGERDDEEEKEEEEEEE